jgi:uncharacterized 2Fe-2S/4Fe-4S cluster protein (DUF4445 family)
VKISVDLAGDRREIQASPGPSLLEFLQTDSIPVNAACGGRGTCNKCRVRLTNGFLASTTADQKAFTPAEIAEGWRLSCQARPKTSIECRLPSLESIKNTPRLIEVKKLPSDFLWTDPRLVVDLGSTGVCASLIDAKLGNVVEAHLLNQQVLIGADVMTRLHYVQVNGTDRARSLLWGTLESIFAEIGKHYPLAFATASNFPILISGNSVMLSLLHGWDSSTLAVAPFRPIKLEADRSKLPSGLVVESLPLMGGFVGADALAGVVAVEDLHRPQGSWALVDIGTNTEIIIRNESGEYFYSSAPAGPAFEGGNILCGMRAEPGAISVAHFRNQNWEIETLGSDKPRGICGSGLFDLIAEGVAAGLIQKDGYLPLGRMEIVGDVKIIADDIREFQLAKAATRTAFDILADRAGTIPKQIFLAGTFAQHLRKDSLEAVGILPPAIPKVIVGNSSLDGLIHLTYLTALERKNRLSRILAQIKGVELALESDFQERFVENINF